MPTPPVVRAFVAAGVMAGLAVPAAADDLSNQSFKIQYDAQGIRSLKRTSDVHDTDYIQAGGALGRLLIRFRTTANGDWRELREMTLVPQGTGGDRVSYMLGTRQRTLAEKSTPSAAVASSRTICRESSSSWRTAPAAPTKRRWRWPVYPPEPTT